MVFDLNLTAIGGHIKRQTRNLHCLFPPFGVKGGEDSQSAMQYGVKREETETGNRRAAAAQDHARRQGADRWLLAGRGRPFQVASRHGRSRGRGGDVVEE